jgi:hypothetical protein
MTTHSLHSTVRRRWLNGPETLLELVYDDPLNAWGDIPVLELRGPLSGRLDAVLAALDLPGRWHLATLVTSCTPPKPCTAMPT